VSVFLSAEVNLLDVMLLQYQNPYPPRETHGKMDSPVLQKGLNAISSSLNYIGNAVEVGLPVRIFCSNYPRIPLIALMLFPFFQEGLTRVENRTADIIQETRKHIQKKPNGAAARNQATYRSSMWQQPQMETSRQQPQKETDQELQLKASRDVRWQLCYWFLYNGSIIACVVALNLCSFWLKTTLLDYHLYIVQSIVNFFKAEPAY